VLPFKIKAKQLAEEINASIKPGVRSSIDEIVAEVNTVRSKQQDDCCT
jgi:hypothetical protein